MACRCLGLLLLLILAAVAAAGVPSDSARNVLADLESPLASNDAVVQILQEHKMDRFALTLLDEAALDRLGIAAVGDRLKLLHLAKTLRRRAANDNKDEGRLELANDDADEGLEIVVVSRTKLESLVLDIVSDHEARLHHRTHHATRNDGGGGPGARALAGEEEEEDGDDDEATQTAVQLWLKAASAGLAFGPDRDVRLRRDDDGRGPSRFCRTLFFRSNALHCTATARILIPAECSAIS